MNNHVFLFSPGIWIGEGKVTFSTSPEHIHFYTKWVISTQDEGVIKAHQEVEMRGGGDNVFNDFYFKNVTDKTFKVELENELLGKASGTGLLDSKRIAWDFRDHPDFEGFEVYELQDDGDYMLHAEYVSPDQHRTIIEGRVWRKLP